MTTEEMLVSLVENVKNINSTLNNMNKQFDDVNSKFDDINNQMSEMKADIQKSRAAALPLAARAYSAHCWRKKAWFSCRTAA